MDEGNLAILVDAKTEYTKQLVNIISPNIYLGIKTIYANCKNKTNGKDTLYQFQLDLSEIPKWNQEIINEHHNMLVEASDCDWLEDLLTAVFVSHTRILTSINFNKNKNKINLKIPKVDHFIHLCYIEIARNFWKNPYLFDDTISKFEYQRNRRDAEQIIDNTINETIRKQLPVKHILKEYLGNEFKESTTDFTGDDTNTEHDNLRKMVKAEIEHCSKEKLDKLNINPIDTNDIEKLTTDDTDIIDDSNYNSDNKLEQAVTVASEEEPAVTFASENPVVTFASEKPVVTFAAANSIAEEPVVTLDNANAIAEEPLVTLDNATEKEPTETLDNATKEEESAVSLDAVTKEEESVVTLDTANAIAEEPTVTLDTPSNLDDMNDMNDMNDNNLKVESLHLNIGDDLSNLEEIYIDTPNNKEIELFQKNLTDDKIKTVYIETEDKSKKKNTFNETDIEINYSDSDEDNYKDRKYSKKDFNFFE
jgi:hypothetical protein